MRKGEKHTCAYIRTMTGTYQGAIVRVRVAPLWGGWSSPVSITGWGELNDLDSLQCHFAGPRCELSRIATSFWSYFGKSALSLVYFLPTFEVACGLAFAWNKNVH